MNAQFTFHPERCVGCGACIMACVNENRIDVDEQNPYRLLKKNEYVDGEKVDIVYFTCIGCHACERVCPFAAIQFTSDRKALKCNGCIRNLKRDRLPLCVLACPRQALTIDEKNDVVKEGLSDLKSELEEYNRRKEKR